MKSGKFNSFLSLAVIGLIASTATSSSKGSQLQLEPATELARQNRISNSTITNLHFCPKWYEMVYGGEKHKDIDTNLRIVLKITGDGQGIVNPEGLFYGSPSYLIDLSKVDEKTAKSAWGGVTNAEEETFDLITAFGSPQMDIFHLDTKFANNKISSYRIRGTGISKPAWVQLLNSEEKPGSEHAPLE